MSSKAPENSKKLFGNVNVGTRNFTRIYNKKKTGLRIYMLKANAVQRISRDRILFITYRAIPFSD